MNEAELSPRFHQADAGPERALFRILGMIATCLGALRGQAPKPAGAAPLARGLDGESALRAIMANAISRSSWNTTGTGLSRKSTLEQNLATPRQPRSARGCHPCHRNVPLPMSPVRTIAAGAGALGRAPLTFFDLLPRGFRPGIPKHPALRLHTTGESRFAAAGGRPPPTVALRRLLASRPEATLDDFMECCRAWTQGVRAA